MATPLHVCCAQGKWVGSRGRLLAEGDAIGFKNLWGAMGQKTLAKMFIGFVFCLWLLTPDV